MRPGCFGERQHPMRERRELQDTERRRCGTELVAVEILSGVAGVLASSSPWRPRIAPPRKPPPPAAETQDAELSLKHASRYRAWAELLKRTFDIDVLDCPKCHGRMKLLAMITDGKSVERYLTKLGEPTDVPALVAARVADARRTTLKHCQSA
jgi:hypothetical protein